MKAPTKKPKVRKAAKPARRGDRTPNIGDDEGIQVIRRQPGVKITLRATRARGWRVALALEKLRAQLNAKAPNRSKLSDGAIGDANHRSRTSDHNPWVIDGGMGLVTARDFTHDAGHGCDCTKLAESLRASRDSRIKYLIWMRRKCWSVPRNGFPAWSWQPYHGTNGHTHHMHISVMSSKSKYDSQAPWSLNKM